MVDKTAEQYHNLLNPSHYAASFELLLPCLKNKKILDIGCGTGKYLEKLDKSAIGIDISAPNLRICKEKGLTVAKINLNKALPFENESFDGALLSHILEHVGAPVNLLRETYRVLKGKGMIFIGLPFEKSLVRIILKDHYFKGHPTHLYSFSLDCLKQLFKIVGFKFDRIIIDIPLVKKLNLWQLLYIVQKMPVWFTKWFAGNFWIIGRKNS